MNRTTWAPAGGADVVAATGYDDAFDDRLPTQPIVVGHSQAGLVLGDRNTRAPHVARRPISPAHREPPPARQHHAASTGGVSSREPARHAARPPRSTIRIVVAVVIAAVIGALGYLTWAASSPSAAPDVHARSVPETSPETPDTAAQQADDGPRHPPHGAPVEADCAGPDGVTVFDDVPGVVNLDPELLGALRQAATDAAGDGVRFYVNSGWRSPEHQGQLFREAVAEYGSEEAAARWVAPADTSLHVSGDAIDIGPTDATAWLSQHGAAYGLCQTYRNEPWHYELRPEALERGCPRMYADPTHDPRMQR